MCVAYTFFCPYCPCWLVSGFYKCSEKSDCHDRPKQAVDPIFLVLRSGPANLPSVYRAAFSEAE